MLLCALLSFFGSLMETGTLALLGAVAAMAPAPIYVGLFLWLDRFEPEPPHLLFGAFMWGAGVAGFFGCLFNSLFHLGAVQMVDPESARQLTASLSAPLMEETLKGLAVAILFFWRRADFDGVLDGIIYAGMAALGFATVENISYYARGMSGGIAQFGVVFVVRGILSPYAHVLFTALTGIGFGLARNSRGISLRVLAPLGGWILAMTLHALWNTIPMGGDLLLLLSYLVIWIPIFLGLVTLIVVSLRREASMIHRHLLQNPQGSPLNASDAAEAARMMPRLLGNLPILFSRGWTDWRRIRRYQRSATALAFYRHRLGTGRIQPDPALEQRYIGEIVECRPA
jgi:RsiW-degrading membrane proteinase PrsW (M82 family)